MKKEMLKDYLEKGKLNIDKMLDDFYGYVYIIVKNGVSSHITDEDVEEIISDVFVAIWKNRDYFIQEGEKISKIGDVELKISQWEEMYIVTFEHNDIYFDIETTGITENQLVDLLESIIDNSTK